MNNQTRNLTLQDLIQQLAARDARIRELEQEMRELDAQEERELPLRAKGQMAYEAQVVRIWELEQQLKAAQERLAHVMSRLDTWADDLQESLVDAHADSTDLEACVRLIVPEMRTSLKEYFAKHANPEGRQS